MASHPFTPHNFNPVQVRKVRHRVRHRVRRRRWSALLNAISLAGVPIACLIALTYVLVRHPITLMIGDPSQSPVATVPVATEKSKIEPRDPVMSPLPKEDGTPARPIELDPKWSGDFKPDPKVYGKVFESELPVHAHNSIDDFVFLNLFNREIEHAKLCSDAAFLRRVYVDTLGTLPTAEQARDFLDDPDEFKRRALVDDVLEQPEFADYWAMKWCDVLRVKAEFPINLWPNAAHAYHRWIRTAIKDEMPFDRFALELLTSSGSNFRKPQVNFYRALQSKEPQAIAQVVALTFMCERTDNWPQDRLEGMGQFFSKVGYKPTGEWKEEIIFYDRRLGDDGASTQAVTAVFPNGVSVQIPAGKDPREVFAQWLVNEKNPWFARAVANRVWYWLFSRGIVDPPDDVRSDNRASNIDLLNHLADELIKAKFDLKHLYRLILNSAAYQLACIPQSSDSQAAEHFAFYQPSRLDAEVLIDAICQITGTTETYMSIIPEPFTFLPDYQRAIALPDGSITSSFLETFGRPPRDTGLVSERNNRPTANQALHLLNSNHIRNKLERGPGIRALLNQARTSNDKVERLYLAILSRRPSEEELHTATMLCELPGGTRDLTWALINSDEFMFRH